LGNLTTPPSVQKLQSALHAKAKEEPGYRFYLLYDKVYRADVLEFGLALARGDVAAPKSPVGGVYYLHGCLLTRVLWSPSRWRTIKPYNLKGLFQALSDPMPFIALRL